MGENDVILNSSILAEAAGFHEDASVRGEEAGGPVAAVVENLYMRQTDRFLL